MSKKDNKYLSLEDRLIWSAYVAQENINHHHQDDFLSFEDLLEYEKTQDLTIKSTPTPHYQANPKTQSKQTPQSFEVDRRTDEKLRKGKMQIEARCDLHGLNQVQAHALLKSFILSAASRGCRCVLVITGKGKPRVATHAAIEPEHGVLKQKVPQWLMDTDIRSLILKSYPAQAKDGGTGALYVYLRRSRTP